MSLVKSTQFTLYAAAHSQEANAGMETSAHNGDICHSQPRNILYKITHHDTMSPHEAARHFTTQTMIMPFSVIHFKVIKMINNVKKLNFANENAMSIKLINNNFIFCSRRVAEQ